MVVVEVEVEVVFVVVKVVSFAVAVAVLGPLPLLLVKQLTSRKDWVVAGLAMAGWVLRGRDFGRREELGG